MTECILSYNAYIEEQRRCIAIILKIKHREQVFAENLGLTAFERVKSLHAATICQEIINEIEENKQ